MILDLVIILIIALFTFIGYKQGLVKIAIRILAFFIALIVAMSIYQPVANLIMDKTNIDENIENAITSKILPGEIKEKTTVLPEGLVNSGVETVNELSASITEKTISVATFIIIFFVLKFGLKFISFLADLITKLPIIKQLDKAGGIVFGLLRGGIIVVVIFAVISLASPLIDTSYIETINNSIIGAYLYNHNLLLGLIK